MENIALISSLPLLAGLVTIALKTTLMKKSNARLVSTRALKDRISASFARQEECVLSRV
jgi:hypothetical protein